VFDLPEGRAAVMGVLNVTPDSFSDGGRFGGDPGAAAEAGIAMARDGADLVDVGGESTRPGAGPVPAEEEAARVVPVVRRLAAAGVAVSVDTSKPSVAEQALDAGAAVVNDVAGLRDPAMRALCARHGCAVCIMHMQGEPRTMQANPRYGEVVQEVSAWLEGQSRLAEDAGVAPGRIWLDPGFGFGKTLEHNLALLGGLGKLVALGRPVLVGVSRKSFLGRLLGLDEPLAREAATRGAECWAVGQGARVVRTHSVKSATQAIRAYESARAHAPR
jgi:dihydropteroate synthase